MGLKSSNFYKKVIKVTLIEEVSINFMYTLGKNHIIDDTYHTNLTMALHSIKTMFYGTCYQLYAETVNKWRIYIGIHFNDALVKIPSVNAYATSFENSYGITHDLWADGDPVVMKNLKYLSGIVFKLKKRSYLKEKWNCRDESFYQCFEKLYASADFSHCPRKCTHSTFGGSMLPDCQTINESVCANNIGYFMRHDIPSCSMKKPCNFYEFTAKGKWEDASQNSTHRIMLAYEFFTNEKTQVYEEYLIYDTVALVGAIGGTLGMFIGFSFSNTLSYLLNHVKTFLRSLE